MNMMICQHCSENFDTLLRIPRILSCGHTFCSSCLEPLVQKEEFDCPLDQKTFSNYKSIDNITINLSLLGLIQNTELRCYSHPDRISVKVDLQNGFSYCETCPSHNCERINYDELKEVLIKSLRAYSNMPKLTEEYRNLLIECCSNSSHSKAKNSNRLELLRILSFRSNTIFCDSEDHKPKQAAYMNFYTKQVLCEECKSCEDQDFELISQDHFKTLLIKRILWVRRAANKLEGKLALEYSELALIPIKSLITEYQSLAESKLLSPTIQKLNKCKECQSVFSLNNEPWVLPCIDSHIVCSNCVPRDDYMLCPHCPANTVSYHASSLDPLYSFENKAPHCPYCKKPYDTKVHLPKEFPCGHVICLNCLKLNYLEVRPIVTKCNSCGVGIENLKSLPTSMYLVKKVQASVISCSKHRNRTASCIEVISLRSWCSECEGGLIENLFLFKIRNEQMGLNTFLLNLYKKLAKDRSIELGCSEGEFKNLSSQQMLDELRAAIEPQLRPQLFSALPKGREIQDLVNIKNKCTLFRFMSLMPPHKTDPEFDFLCRPWKVECDKNQVECLSFKSIKNVTLDGIILAQGVYNTLISIKKIEIIQGQSLNSSNKRLFSCEIDLNLNRRQWEVLDDMQILNEPDDPVRIEFPRNTNEHELAFIRFNESISILAGEYYSILIRLEGKKVLLFRGNPFELKEEFWGSDGTLFHFTKVSDWDNHYIEGQHELSGPILGLIYE